MRSNTYVRAVVAVICLALPLILAAPSMATSPTGGISFLDVTGGSTATVRTSVNPQGSQTSAHLEYGIASSAFCTSFGVDAGGKNFSNFQDVGSGTNSLQVTFELSGLSGGTEYCLQLVASNGVDPDDIDYYGTFFAGIPEAYTSEAHSTNATTVNVKGEIDPNGQDTIVRVRYDTSASVFCQNNGEGGSPHTSTAFVGGGSDNGTVDVSINLTTSETGVSTGAAGCVMIVAGNASGASRSFGTIPVVVGAPEIPGQSARGKSATSVRLSAQIWTANQDTTVHAEYAVDGSDFCANDGLSGAHSTTPNSVVPAAATEQTAYATVTGLPTNTDYCVVWLATNASAGAHPFIHGRFHHRRPGRDDARRQRHQLERGDAQRQRQPRGNNTTALLRVRRRGLAVLRDER